MRSPLVSSDALPALRRAISQDLTVAASFDAPRLRVVVDANIVLRELYWIHKTRRNEAARSHFREVVDAGVIVPYAPLQLEHEVVAQFQYFAHQHGIPEDVLQDGWKDLRRLIKQVPPRTVASHASSLQAIMRRDPNDVPYVALALQIGAAGVLTCDSDFAAADVSVYDSTVVAALRTHARSAAVELTALATGKVTLNMTVAISRDLWHAFRRLPAVVQFAIAVLGVGTVVGLLRARGADRLGGLAVLLESVAPAVEKLAEARTARLSQPVAGLANRRPYALVDFAAVICAEAEAPIDVREIASRAITEGYRTDSRMSSVYLRRVLRKDGRFVEHRRHAWTLASR